MSPWIDHRQQFDVIRDRLEERALALGRRLEAVWSLLGCGPNSSLSTIVRASSSDIDDHASQRLDLRVLMRDLDECQLRIAP
jgi:hypothetical protein